MDLQGFVTPLDENGQPARLFRRNRDNNAAKAIDELSGICTGILLDGVVTEKEALNFAQWVQTHAPLEPVWPFTDILVRIQRIFQDGLCDDEEREELKTVMERLCGHAPGVEPLGTCSTTLPLDAPAPDSVVFQDRSFVITGKFAFGSRNSVMEEIQRRGGMPSDSSPSRKTNCLIIGFFASRDWKNTNFGRKIEKAVQLRESGTGITIISEEHWKKFL